MSLARMTILKVRGARRGETARLVLLSTATGTRIVSAYLLHRRIRCWEWTKNKARSSVTLSGLHQIIPAASYSPTQLPAQYHWLQEAGTSVFGMGTRVTLSTPKRPPISFPTLVAKQQHQVEECCPRSSRHGFRRVAAGCPTTRALLLSLLPRAASCR